MNKWWQCSPLSEIFFMLKALRFEFCLVLCSWGKIIHNFPVEDTKRTILRMFSFWVGDEIGVATHSRSTERNWTGLNRKWPFSHRSVRNHTLDLFADSMRGVHKNWTKPLPIPHKLLWKYNIFIICIHSHFHSE